MSNTSKFLKSYRFLQVISGIMYFCIAILALRYKPNTITGAIQIFGIFSLIKGCFELLNKDNIKKRTHHNQYSSFVLGGVDLLIGILMIFNTSLNLNTLSILFGIWFISDSIISFFLLDLAKKISQIYYYVSMVIYLVGGLIGFILLIAGTTTIVPVPTLICIYFLLFGFVKLVGGLLNRRDIHTTD